MPFIRVGIYKGFINIFQIILEFEKTEFAQLADEEEQG